MAGGVTIEALQATAKEMMGVAPPMPTTVGGEMGAGGIPTAERAVSGSLNELYSRLSQVVKAADQRIYADSGVKSNSQLILESQLAGTAIQKLLDDIDGRLIINPHDAKALQDRKELEHAAAHPDSVYRRKWEKSDYSLRPADYETYSKLSKQVKEAGKKTKESVFTKGDFIKGQQDQWRQFLRKPDDETVFIDRVAEIQRLRGIAGSKNLPSDQVDAAKEKIVDLTMGSGVDAIQVYFQIEATKKLRGVDFSFAKYADLAAKKAKMIATADEQVRLGEYESLVNESIDNLGGFYGDREMVAALLSGGYRDKNQFPDLTVADVNALNYLRAMTENVVKAAGGDLGRGTVATRVEAAPAMSVAAAVPVAEASASVLKGEEIPPTAYIKTKDGDLNWETFQNRMLAAADKTRQAGAMTETQIQEVIARKMSQFRSEMKTA